MAEAGKHFRGVAVDVGNSAIHCGWFDGSAATELPQPNAVLCMRNGNFDTAQLDDWFAAHAREATTWRIASVNQNAADELVVWLRGQTAKHRLRRISHHDCPLPINVQHPEKGGIDRLMAATAARHLAAGQAAIVIDAGTAITVDLLTDGAFQGGAILPGMRMSAAALDRYTDKLPLVDTTHLDSPDVVGRDTHQAMQSGLFWGMVGAVKELTHRLGEGPHFPPHIFLTGGEGPALAPHIDGVEIVPNLVLRGIALVEEPSDA